MAVVIKNNIMTADSEEELVRFAISIGMESSWKKENENGPYYEVRGYKKRRAVQNGARIEE